MPGVAPARTAVDATPQRGSLGPKPSTQAIVVFRSGRHDAIDATPPFPQARSVVDLGQHETPVRLVTRNVSKLCSTLSTLNHDSRLDARQVLRLHQTVYTQIPMQPSATCDQVTHVLPSSCTRRFQPTTTSLSMPLHNLAKDLWKPVYKNLSKPPHAEIQNYVLRDMPQPLAQPNLLLLQLKGDANMAQTSSCHLRNTWAKTLGTCSLFTQ